MSEFVRVSKTELEQLQDLVKSVPDLQRELDGFRQWQQEQKNRESRPAFLYAGANDDVTGSSRSEKAEAMRHFGRVAKAIIRKDNASYNKEIDQYPEWYLQKAAFSEAANGEGLYLAPSVWSDLIFSNVERYGFARKLANVIPMPARDVKFNTGAGAVTVAWPGNNTAPTPHDATSHFTQTSLTASTMAAAAIIQKELDEDGLASLYDYLVMRYGKAIAKEEDLQFFNGTGSPFTGIVGTVTTNIVYQGNAIGSGKTLFDNVSWTDMVNLKNKVNPDIQTDGVYVVSQTVFGFLQKEVDDNHRPIFNHESPRPNQNNTGIDQAPWIYNGSPLWVVGNAVLPTSAASRVSAVFGDFQNEAIFGVRRDVTLETFDQAYGGVDLAGQRQVALQVTERVAIAFPDETAFAVLKTSAS